MVFDEEIRDVLAGLSWYVGTVLPNDLAGVAQANGLPADGWVFPAPSVPGAAGDTAGVDVRQVGRSLREHADQAGVRLLIRGDAGWPAGTGCDDLPCLWVSGDPDVARHLERTIVVTGSNIATPYGTFQTQEFVQGLLRAGRPVATGALNGISYVVTETLAALRATAAVLVSPCGLDLAWTAGTTGVAATTVSPFPCGYHPNPTSVEMHYRLLGTLGVATVLVEADLDGPSILAGRSAAGRTVFAVPGPVTSRYSQGCHALIAERTAMLAEDAGAVVAALDAKRAPTGRPTLYQVTGTAQWDDGYWHSRAVPAVYVKADTHDDAARLVFDLVFAVAPPGATLTAGVYASDGTYRPITIAVAT